MDATEIPVALGSLGAIAFVLWYFFGEKARAAPRAASSSSPRSRAL